MYALFSVEPQRSPDDDFVALYRSQANRVHRRLLLLTGPGNHLEDLVQQTFLELHRSLPNFKGQCRKTTWLARITINVAAQHNRKRRRKPPPELGLEGHESELGAPGDQEQHVAFREAYAALNQLPEKLKIPFVLREVEGMTLDEIATVTGCSISTASARVERARKVARKALERRSAR